MRTLIVLFGTLAWIVYSSQPLAAAIVVHTNSALVTHDQAIVNFNSAVANLPPITIPTVVNFDSTPVGTEILNGGTFGGITFQYGPSFLQERLRVTDGTGTLPAALSTTSGTRFLGTGVSEDQLAAGGVNNFTMVFNTPVRAIGLSIILSANDAGQLFAGDFLLTAGTASASLDPTLSPSLADGSRAFFLGLTEDTGAALGLTVDGRSQITISSLPITFGIKYRIDDIRSVVAVPEPSAMAGGLWLLGIVGPMVRRSRRRVA